MRHENSKVNMATPLSRLIRVPKKCSQQFISTSYISVQNGVFKKNIHSNRGRDGFIRYGVRRHISVQKVQTFFKYKIFIL